MNGILNGWPGQVAPVWEGEGEGAGGAGGGEGTEFTPPEGLPPEFVGADAGETLGKLFNGFTEVSTRHDGLRDKLAKVPAAAKSADEFQFTPSEKAAPFFNDTADNPVLDIARKAALENGIPTAAFEPFINGIYEAAGDAGLLVAPYNPAGEIESFMKGFELDEAGAQAAMVETDAFAKGLVGQLEGIPEALKEEAGQIFEGLTDTAAGNALLKSLSARLSASGFKVAGDATSQSGELTKEELHRLDSDPRIDTMNEHHSDKEKRFDPELRKIYDAAYARLYPGVGGD
jgi:hypothetical protein